jgi:hypothetical protein
MQRLRLSVCAWVVVFYCPLVFSQTSDATRQVALDLGHGIKLTMTASPFDPRKHSVERCQHEDWSGVCLIDGKPVFGTDGDVPRARLDRATVQVKSRVVELDTSCMYDPWVGRPDSTLFSAAENEDGILITGKFSDGAGSYFAQWLVVKGGSVRTVLSTDEELLEGS